jgi:glutamate 5-kinase
VRDLLRKARRIVVKIGTGVLTDPKGRFDAPTFGRISTELAACAKSRQVVVVSSGAVALGVERLHLPARPTDIPGKQAAAAVGQSRLMARYDEALGALGVTVAQVLLSHDDLASRKRYLNARRTLERLIEAHVVPVINENDTVSVDELKFGDNDALAALVVGLVGADALIVLSDVGGLYTADPRSDSAARLVPEVVRVNSDVEQLAAGSTGARGTGGMSTKVRAARRAAQAGAITVIAEGKREGVLAAVLQGEEIGTVFGADDRRLTGVRRFLAHAATARGELRVDDGARRAISENGKSLLPAGVKAVRGSFGVGDPIDISDAKGRPFARGVAGYSADELRQIMGRKTAEIAKVLGYKYLDEVVHRDDLVLL